MKAQQRHSPSLSLGVLDSGLGREISLIHEEPQLQRPAASGALPAALGRDCLQPAPAFLIIRQQGGPISSLEAACVQAQSPELYRLHLNPHRPLPGKGPRQEEGGSPFRGWSEQTPAGEPGVGGNRARCSHCVLPLPRDSGGGVFLWSLEPVRMLTVGGSGL